MIPCTRTSTVIASSHSIVFFTRTSLHRQRAATSSVAKHWFCSAVNKSCLNKLNLTYGGTGYHSPAKLERECVMHPAPQRVCESSLVVFSPAFLSSSTFSISMPSVGHRHDCVLGSAMTVASRVRQAVSTVIRCRRRRNPCSYVKAYFRRFENIACMCKFDCQQDLSRSVRYLRDRLLWA